MRTFFNAAGLVLVIAALVIFCVLNIGRVDLTMIVLNDWQIEYMAWPLPLCVLVLVPLGCGIVLGALLDSLAIMKLRARLRAAQKELEEQRNRIRPA